MHETNKSNSSNGNLYQKAYEIAEIAYSGNIRKSGEPLINHAKRIVDILRKTGIRDETILSTALLHDVIKVKSLTYEDIAQEFNSDIADMVKILTEISLIPIPINKDEATIEDTHKMIIHLAKDIRVLIIRLADRIDNIKTSQVFDDNDRIWIAQLSLSVYAPIAKSAGIYAYVEELESEALKILEPKTYYQIKNFTKKYLKESEQKLQAIEDSLKIELNTYKIEYEVSYRTKSIYSIYTKSRHKYNKGEISSPVAYNELFDLLGVRIILTDIESCYKIYSFLQKKWPIILSEYDDYIAKPKPNGYRSIQSAIQIDAKYMCEVQIRTFEMHQMNEYGAASHFAYKFAKYSKGKIVDSAWVQELVKLKDQIQHEITTDSKINLFEDTVFVFTPKKDLITLPQGSTPIDFAYELHSSLGNKCEKAKADGKLIPLSAHLKSGQTIEITTSSHRNPSQDWLMFVKTNKAKEHIRRYLYAKGTLNRRNSDGKKVNNN